MTDIEGYISDTSPTDYKVYITNLDGVGEVKVSLPENEVMNGAHHPNAASTSIDNSVTFYTPEMDLFGETREIPDGYTFPVADLTSFGSTPLTLTDTLTFTIENNGTAPLTLSGSPIVAINGSSDFTVTELPITPLAVSDTTSFSVTFEPSSLGIKTATVSIVNNDRDENPYDFLIQGVGVTLATLTTKDISEITNSDALVSAEVTYDGESFVYERGICWSTSSQPTLSDNHVASGMNFGEYSATITGLSQNVEYFVRAYAINQAGTAYGNELSFYSGIPISSLSDLEMIGNDPDYPLSGNYYLTNNIDMGDTAEPTYNSGEGFVPIGFPTSFTGMFDGNGYSIIRLYINRPLTNNIGLFNVTRGATIFDLNIKDAEIVGYNSTAILAGEITESTVVFNCSAMGTVTGNLGVGGLIGRSYNSEVAQCASGVDIVAYFFGGGMTGYNYDCDFTDCYATGDVDADDYSGAFVGGTHDSSFTNCYAAGQATATNSGGFASSTDNCTYTDCFYNSFLNFTDVTTATGKSEENLRKQATFTNWDFTDTWAIIEDRSYPHFQPTTRFGITINQAPEQEDATLTLPIIFDLECEDSFLNFSPSDIKFDSTGITVTSHYIGTYSSSTRHSVRLWITGVDGRGVIRPYVEADTIMNTLCHMNSASIGIDDQVTYGAPEISVYGNERLIPDGKDIPFFADNTDFGNVNTYSDSVTLSYNIYNTGDVPLILNSPMISITGSGAGNFFVSDLPSATINATESSSFSITCAAIQEGTFTATISILNTDPDENPYDFVIQGNGVTSEISVIGNDNTITNGDTTPSLEDHTDFGSTDVTLGTISRTFTIENTGTGSLTFSKLSFRYNFRRTCIRLQCL